VIFQRLKPTIHENAGPLSIRATIQQGAEVKQHEAAAASVFAQEPQITALTTTGTIADDSDYRKCFSRFSLFRIIRGDAIATPSDPRLTRSQ
jgi:hypothetical protein